jgi:hypothetical protein
VAAKFCKGFVVLSKLFCEINPQITTNLIHVDSSVIGKMVRTKADNCSKKAVAAKAPRKVLGGATHSPSASSSLSSPSSAKVSKYAGGNPACARPTPEWQKGISTFLKRLPPKEGEEDGDEEKENGTGSGTEVEMSEETEAVTSENAGASSQTSSSSADCGSSSQSTSHQRNGIIDSDDDD